MPTALLTRKFSAQSRERGAAIARSGAVRSLRITDNVAVAEVDGTDDYVVAIEVMKRTASLGCSCPHCADGAFCKHVWATLLRVESAPEGGTLVAALAKVTSVRLEPVTDGEEELLLFDELEDFDEAGIEFGADQAGPTAPHVMPAAPTSIPAWQLALDRAAWQMRSDEVQNGLDSARAPRTEWPDDRRLVYVIDSVVGGRSLLLEVMTEQRARDGKWSVPKRFGFSSHVWMQAPDPRDRAITRLLLGAAPLPDYGHARTSFVIAPDAIGHVIPAVCATGRARLKLAGPPRSLIPVTWHDAADHADRPSDPWRFGLALQQDEAGWSLVGELVRGEERRSTASVGWMHASGLCLIDGALAPVAVDGQWPLMFELLRQQRLPIGDDPAPVLEQLFALPSVPELSVPPELSISMTHDAPIPGVRFVADPVTWRRNALTMVGVELAFRYGANTLDATNTGRARFDPTTRTLHHRDHGAEQRARDQLLALGVTIVRETGVRGAPLALPRAALRRVAEHLVADGWWAEVDGRAFRMPGAVQARVRSGVDWFDLEGTVPYGDVMVPLADVIEARRRGQELVPLPDGSLGVLPQEWLDRLGPIFSGGEASATGVRFRSSQLALLDALLATLPDVDVDAAFARARDALRGFDCIAPSDPPASFKGTLRTYQREGLGWLHFLRTFGFGGCLADDMGLGKTIQVLALLDARRADGHGPSLVVVPRSLVFNWRSEAAQFAPSLRVADWSNATRHESEFDTREVDVAIVTYGTLRRDAARLAETTFDYVVLDEAQAIKNRGTATAKACRVLQAAHRLALSGTPVENRLEELWSLLDFLNPGMLGPSSRFASSLRDVSSAAGIDEVLARALRPVILRRTKSEVAPELPARIERTLEVELEPKQRAFYDKLHAKVRADVFSQVESRGLGRSKLHILEGLLRLRQAACHPVLADATKRALPSAKLDALIPALIDAAAEGQKALVFSQFTTFLALVRAALDKERIPYEYLDGKTKDRQARVDRFQNDPACPVFLISLKAGGQGLNLTAADYVYLLDPWWNPAVEAQAIDRAHRIGRTRHVIATRLVAQGTIEAKILALQASKRALADAILSADRGGLASIGREELELLLG